MLERTPSDRTDYRTVDHPQITGLALLKVPVQIHQTQE